MGLLKKLKKGLKPLKAIAKIAVKTAPIWTNFIPVGGSFVNTAISKVAPLLEKGKQLRSKLKNMGGTAQAIASLGSARATPTAVLAGASHGLRPLLGGPRHREMAQRSDAEENAFHAQGVVHAGIRGPVAQRFGPIHSHLQGRRFQLRGGGGMRRRSGTTRRRTRRGRFVSRGRGGRFVRRYRRRAA